MKIAPLLSSALVLCRMKAADKEAALRELADRVARERPGLSSEEVVRALAARERLGPFSLGKGVAFPHARTEQIQEFTVAVGTAPEGIDFRAADGLPVRLVILFLIPMKHSNLYLQAMAAFLNFFSLEGNLTRVLEAATPEELIAGFETSRAPGIAGPTVRALMDPAPPKVTRASPLSEVVDLLRRSGLASVAVVDTAGALVGEVRAATLLKVAARGALSSALDTVTLAPEATVERYLAEHGAIPIGEQPGLMTNGVLPTLQQEEPAAAAALRMARAGIDTAFVLERTRLVGLLRAVSLLGPHGRT